MAPLRRKRCAYRPCPPETDYQISFFSFPKEPERIAEWLKACNREDLLSKTVEELHKNYRLCEKHFEPIFYSIGKTRKHLWDNAIPTIFEHNVSKNIYIEDTVIVNIPEDDDFLSMPGPSGVNIQNEVETVPTSTAANEDFLQMPGPSRINIQGVASTSTAANEDFLQMPGPSGINIQGVASTSTAANEDFLQMPGPCRISIQDVASTSMSVPHPKLSPSVGSQTPKFLSASSPRKMNLRKKLKASRKQLYKQQILPRKRDWSINDFKEMCEQYLGQPLTDIIQVQSELKNKQPRARRYSKQYKQFALTLYFLGPRAYAFLSKILCLPNKRTLQKMTEKIIIKPGLQNDAIFKALEVKVQTLIDVDKHCTICIDEMSLKSNLFYNTSRDELVGLKDIGKDIKEFDYAQHALVIMVRGLYNNWKQPLAYFFVTSQFEALELKNTIIDCIEKLDNLGLVVDAVVSDMGSNFIQLSRELGVTIDNSEIEVCGKKVIYLFDICHLIKAARNNLLKNVIHFDNMKTSWSFVEAFYQRDSQQFYRCAPKLTRAHLFPTNFQKLKVKLATQVLSHTVASGMNVYLSLGAIPNDAIGTIDFIEKCNNLFDILNSYDLNENNKFKKVFQGETFQMEFLSEMLSFLKDIELFDKEGKNVTAKSKFKKCWIITINGLLSLWSKLSDQGFKYIKTRRLNSDCLENFFGSVRQQGGNSINPIPIQFERAFKKLFCQSYLHSGNMNCKEDLDNLLITFDPKKCFPINCYVPDTNTKAIVLNDYDYRLEDMTFQNPFKYVCGYVIKKALSIHTCNLCTKFSKDCEDLDSSQLLTFFKAFDSDRSTYGGLRTPSEHFIHYIYQLEKIFVSQFSEICLTTGISHKLLEIMKDIELKHPCSNFPKLYVLKLFIRLKIFYTIKYINRDIKENRRDKNNKTQRKMIIISHL